MKSTGKKQSAKGTVKALRPRAQRPEKKSSKLKRAKSPVGAVDGENSTGGSSAGHGAPDDEQGAPQKPPPPSQGTRPKPMRGLDADGKGSDDTVGTGSSEEPWSSASVESIVLEAQQLAEVSRRAQE